MERETQSTKFSEEKAGRAHLSQVIKVNITSNATWIACTPGTMCEKSMSSLWSSSPQPISQSNQEKTSDKPKLINVL